MPPASTSPSPSSSEVLLQAADLLFEWEQSRPVDSEPATPELRTAYMLFVAEVLCDPHATNLDIADVQVVLHPAAGLAVDRAEASGPGRALQAFHEATQNTQATGPRTATHGLMLLSVQSRPDNELGIDELTDITEALWRTAGPEWEMIFGHGIVLDLPAEIRLTFMLAPAGLAQSQPANSTNPAT